VCCAIGCGTWNPSLSACALQISILIALGISIAPFWGTLTVNTSSILTAFEEILSAFEGILTAFEGILTAFEGILTAFEGILTELGFEMTIGLAALLRSLACPWNWIGPAIWKGLHLA